MAYTVQQLASLSGVSARTLRYYDQIGLLRPGRDTENDYRLYGGPEVDRLQQILFYRALGVELSTIGKLLDVPEFDRAATLKAHLLALKAQKTALEGLIRTVETTIRADEEGIIMKDAEKFEGFKANMIAENERKYGAQIRAAYGDEMIDQSNAKLQGMSAAAFANAKALEQAVSEALKKAVEAGDPAGPEAQAACDLHRQWLVCYWPVYTKEMHLGLGEGYVADPRFAAYYEKIAPNAAVFLRDALRVYCG